LKAIKLSGLLEEGNQIVSGILEVFKEKVAENGSLSAKDVKLK